MPLTIENVIDLSIYAGNPEPKFVEQLSIVHEPVNGELVQYYISPEDGYQGDKKTNAIGVYNATARRYSYVNYDRVQWGAQQRRITLSKIRRLGVKSFPDIGAFAFYIFANRENTRIIIPVNRKRKDYGTDGSSTGHSGTVSLDTNRSYYSKDMGKEVKNTGRMLCSLVWQSQ